MSIAEKTCS